MSKNTFALRQETACRWILIWYTFVKFLDLLFYHCNGQHLIVSDWVYAVNTGCTGYIQTAAPEHLIKESVESKIKGAI